MLYVEAPEPTDFDDDAVTVFLAGGIGNCPDWQADMVSLFEDTSLVLLNPRRKEFEVPWTRQASEEQINWEFEALKRADIVLFWFAEGGSVQPIALYELGSHARDRGKRIVVGTHPDYARRDDIEIQVRLLRGKDFPIYNSLVAVADAVEFEAERIQRARGL
jgi:hypothetical protein